MRGLHRSGWLMSACVFLTLASCQRGPVPVGASGMVTYNGKPVPEGVIVFEPVDAMQGQRREAKIVNGEYTLPTEQGAAAGSAFRVSIKAFRKTGRKYPAADPALAMDEVEQYLPDKYNVNSTERVTFSDDAARNRFEFQLQAP